MVLSGLLLSALVVQDMVGNDNPLDFGCPFVDGEHSGIPVKPLHWIILNKTVPTMHLDRFGRDSVNHL